jgi:hypothetical protein
MYTALLRFASKQYQPDNWPHGYEDLDHKVFKRWQRSTIDLDDGDDQTPPPPQPAEGPAPPIHSEYVRRSI